MSREAERVMNLGKCFHKFVSGVWGVVSRFMMCDYGKYC